MAKCHECGKPKSDYVCVACGAVYCKDCADDSLDECECQHVRTIYKRGEEPRKKRKRRTKKEMCASRGHPDVHKELFRNESNTQAINGGYCLTCKEFVWNAWYNLGDKETYPQLKTKKLNLKGNTRKRRNG